MQRNDSDKFWKKSNADYTENVRQQPRLQLAISTLIREDPGNEVTISRLCDLLPQYDLIMSRSPHIIYIQLHVLNS